MDNISIEKYKIMFNEIFKNKVYPVLKEFESIRKIKLLKCILLTFIYILITVFSFYISRFVENRAFFSEVGFLFAVLPFISLYIINKNFVSDLKEKCIPEILSGLENIKWKRDVSVISDEEIRASIYI